MSTIEVDLKAFVPIAVTGMPSIVSGITIDASATPSFKPVIITSPLFSVYLKILFKTFPPFLLLTTKKEPEALKVLGTLFLFAMCLLYHTILALSTYTNVISAFGDDSKALASIFFTLSEMNISFIFLQLSKISPLILLAESHSTFSRLPQ